MFNTQHFHRGGEDRLVPYEKTVTITEKRAPTDDSIKLLNEMQEKAKQNILTQITVDNNILKAHGIIFAGGYHSSSAVSASFKTKWILKFSLNGKEYRCEGELDEHEFQSKYAGNNPEARWWFIHDLLMPQFSKVIADEIMKSVPNSLKPLIG